MSKMQMVRPWQWVLRLLPLLLIGNLQAQEEPLFSNEYLQAVKYQLEPGAAIDVKAAPHGIVAVTLDEGSLNINGTVTGVLPSGFFYWQPGESVVIKNHGVRPVALFVGRVTALSGIDTGGSTLAKVDYHHLMHENSAVEMYRVTIPPGADTGQHHHTRKGVAFVVSGGKARVTFADGKTVVNEFGDGVAMWHEEELIHRLVNVGESTIQVLDIEWK